MSSQKEKQAPKVSNTSTASSLDRVKEELRKWYGMLSLKEIVTNKALIQELEALEKMLTEQKASLC